MKERKVKVAVIGAGTAGLSALKEIKNVTDDFVIIDNGPLGTTCARVGCMPSKILIQIAEDFHHRQYLAKQGIKGAEHLQINIPEALEYLRGLRDYFTSGVIKSVDALGDKFIAEKAQFLDPQVLQVGNTKIIADKIIIASGSSGVMPPDWQANFPDRILTSDNIFEQKDLNDRIAVIGAGVIGIELGQALSRLGIETSIFHAGEFIGGLTDPVVNAYAIKALREEFPLHTDERASVKLTNGSLSVETDSQKFSTKQILAALGRRPNLSSLNIDKAGITLDKQGLPDYNCTTMQIADLPIFLAGDAFSIRPLLHEAADEGRIAGYNAANNKLQCFKRRVPIHIVFSQPNISVVGSSFQKLKDHDYEIGEVYFDDQGRSRIMSKNKGILRIYGDRTTGKLLGAEMFAPAGEHLAHMLAWAIQQEMTVFDVLQMPYYHPAIQEGMRTALRKLASKIVKPCKSYELAMCQSTAAEGLT